MNQESWKKINSIFHAALDLPASEQLEFVVRLSSGDPELQAEVERLLEADRNAGSYLESPLIPIQSATSGSDLIHPGVRLCGRFNILREIAEGGMGKVFEAFDSELGSHVAIKVIRPEIASNPDAVSRFRQEVRLARLISHLNVCKTFDIEHDVVQSLDGRESHELLFLTMEFLPGETLASRIERTGAFEYEFALVMATEIAAGIDSAHERGIIHRDLKPGNIMLVPAESSGQIHAVITDFGLAWTAALGTEASSFKEGSVHEIPAGTLSYMAPEQLEGKPPTQATDIYSLGLILFEMVTGKRAFPSDNSVEGIKQRLATTGVTTISFPPDFPEHWRSAIESCLQTNPSDRPGSAADVIAILNSGVMPELPADSRTTKPIRKNPLIWITVALLITTGMVMAIWQIEHSRATLYVAAYTQLTHDGLTKYLGGTDGKRLYVTGGPSPISQVSIEGGQLASVPMTVPGNGFLLNDVSRDGALGLVGASGDTNGEGLPFTKLWVFPVHGGSPTFIGDGLVGCFASDGRSVFYFDRNGDLYREGTEGAGRYKVGSYGPGFHDVRMSPDGRVLRITKDDRIWEMSPTGQGLHEVLPNWHAPGSSCCGHWSSDGKLFVFLQYHQTEQIWVLEGDGLIGHREPIQLTTGPNVDYYHAYPSDDGKKLYAEGITSKGELCRFDRRTGQLEPFLGGISAEFVSFSRDRKYVAYVSFPEGILWKANADGSNPVALAGKDYQAINPQWSPDGKLILFATRAVVFPGTYIVNSAGGTPRRSLPNDKESEGDPNWSPDGKQVLLSGGAASPDSDYLRVLDLETQRLTSVPDSQGFWSPRWSPDGRYIAAISWKKPSLRIFDSRKQTWRILPIDGGVSYPSFSRDSKYLFFHLETAKEFAIYRIAVSGGRAERIVDLKDWHLTGSAGSFMSLDPTDAPLVLRDFGTSDLWALTLERK